MRIGGPQAAGTLRFPLAAASPRLATASPGQSEASPSQGTNSPSAERDLPELFALLWRHRRDEGGETFRTAWTMAAACAGDRHLWEDMGLPDRGALSRLIRHHFPALFHKNKGDMRWKKFFYKQMCEGARARVCKAPSCGACGDYAACFGPE